MGSGRREGCEHEKREQNKRRCVCRVGGERKERKERKEGDGRRERK